MTEDNAPRGRGRDFDLSEPVGSFGSTARGVLLFPREFFGGIALRDSLKAPLIFAVICLLVSWFSEGIADYFVEGGFAMVGNLGPGLLQGGQFMGGVATTTAFVALSPLFALLRLYVYAGVVHLFVMLFRDQKRHGFETTLRVYCYASTVALFSWIPFVGWIASLWGLAVLLEGLRAVHGGSPGAATWRAE